MANKMKFRFKDKPAPVAAGEAKMVFGDRTPEQKEAALHAARLARAEKKVVLDRIKKGEIKFEELFTDAYKHDERIQKLPVSTALRAVPGIGIKGAAKLLDEAGIATDRNIRIRGVGSRQREKLLESMAR